MSYILEALKKAQAERQIGSTPTIHAPTLASSPAGQGARSKRTPVIVAMVLMATAIAGLAAMLLRQQPAASQAAAASQPVAASPSPAAGQPPVSGAVVQASSASRTDVGPVVQPPVLAHGTTQALAPHAPAQPPAAKATTQTRRVEPGTSPSGAPLATAPAPAAAPAPVEEPVQALRELPEPIQRAIPQIALGGYMYSKNPADRLLLIDKVLRREGEEVAPGLILEKLQPKQAIFGFRGYRYRVAL